MGDKDGVPIENLFGLGRVDKQTVSTTTDITQIVMPLNKNPAIINIGSVSLTPDPVSSLAMVTVVVVGSVARVPTLSETLPMSLLVVLVAAVVL